MSESSPPQEKSNTAIYLVGILALAGAIGGIVYATRTPDQPAPPPPPKPAETAAQVNNTPPPPPPPTVDEPEDAGTDAPAPTATGKVTTGGGAGGGSCARCGEGEFTPALQSALQAIPGSAQGCYNRALRTSAASGKLTVSVQVGSSGNVCGASIASDTLGSPEIASCVLGRVRGRTFPAPKSGCVVANIPINFQIAQ